MTLLLFLFATSSAWAHSSKTAILVPGMFAKAKSPGYDEVTRALEARGYDVHFVPIKWFPANLSRYSDQLKTALAGIPQGPDTVVVTSSLGGFLALTELPSMNVGHLALVSPTPFFDESIETARWGSWTRIARALMNREQEDYSLKATCDQINQRGIQTTILVADRDVLENRRFAESLSDCLVGDRVLRIQGGHGIRSSETQKTLLNHISTL